MAFSSLRSSSRVLVNAGPLLCVVLLAAGCEDRYSEDLRYPLRSDPLVKKPPTVETPHPDRPGVLPVLSMAQIRELDNPLHSMVEDATAALDPAKIKGEHRQALTKSLDELFGTPARPRVNSLNTSAVADLRLDNRTLRMGSRLYRIHCLHCHGMPGDGRGPTAFWVNPHPRDYRQGIFKFVSTSVGQGPGQKPRREDLMQVLRQGIDGTSMPSFNVLPDQELQAMASYVIHLSLRGEVEFYTMSALIEESGLQNNSVEGHTRAMLATLINDWKNCQTQVIAPAPFPYKTDEQMKASVLRGLKIFMDEKDGCVKCHPSFGRSSLFRFDSWGTEVRPADLTTGLYRGGRRPLDLYHRVYAGINGSGMASFRSLQDNADEKQNALWDVVNFVQILPYPAMRAKYGINID